MPATTSPSTGTARTRRPRCSAPARAGAGTRPQGLAWIHQGGGKELYRELIQDVLGLNVVGFFAMPMPTQPLGWFKNELEGPDDLAGPEVPHRRPRRRRVPEDGPGGRAAARRRDPAGHGARRDRRLRVQQPDLGPPLRRPGRRQELHAGQLPSGDRVLRDHLQQGQVRRAARRAPGDPGIRRRGRLDGQPGDRPRQLLAATWSSCRSEDGVQVWRTPQSILDAQLKAWDELLARPDRRTRSSPRWSRARRPGPSASCSTSSTTPPTSAWPTSTTSASSRSEPRHGLRRPAGEPGRCARRPGPTMALRSRRAGAADERFRALRRPAEPVGRPHLRLVHHDPDARRSATRCSCATCCARRPAGRSTSAT